MGRTNSEPSLTGILQSMRDEIEQLKSFVRQNCYSPGDIKMSAIEIHSELWILCDGASYEKIAYPALNLFLKDGGYRFGQTSTTFNVPDLRGRSPRGIGKLDGVGPSDWVLGDKNGSEALVMLGGTTDMTTPTQALAFYMKT